MKQITVNGNTYKSISAAWRAEAREGLSEWVVRQRLKLGWHPEDAFSLAVVPPKIRYKGHTAGE